MGPHRIPGAGACPGTRVVSQVPAHRIGGVIERLARAHSDGCDIRAVGRQIAAELGETDEQGLTAAQRRVLQSAEGDPSPYTAS